MSADRGAINTVSLHQQAAAHLAATADAPGVHELSVTDARVAMQGYLQLQRPPVEVPVEHRFIPGPTADLPVRTYRPSSDVGPAVVVLHGSGWVAANLDLVDEPARRLAVDTGFTVIAVNYQKAPEHPFPVPLEDCIATVRWVFANAEALRVDPARVAVVGDSAGGNLAAATVNALVPEVPIAGQALLYPALDERRGSASYVEFACGYGLGAADMAWFWGHYLPADHSPSPRTSPLLAADLPAVPTFVATAECDVLRDEGEAYAGRLPHAVLRRYAGMIHGFWWMDGVLDGSRELQRDLADFLRTTLS